MHYIYDDEENDRFRMFEYMVHLLKRHYLTSETYAGKVDTNEIEVIRPKYRGILLGFSVYHVWLDDEYGWNYLSPSHVDFNEVLLQYCLIVGLHNHIFAYKETLPYMHLLGFLFQSVQTVRALSRGLCYRISIKKRSR